MSRERVAIAPIASDAGGFDAIVERARRRGFRRFVMDADRPFAPLPTEEVARRSGAQLETPGGARVPIVVISTAEELETALGPIRDAGTIAIEWTGDRVIPLENAVALRGRRFEIWSYARSPAEVPGALGALEHGADLVIVETHAPAEVDAIEAAIEGPLPGRLDWASVPVVAVGPAGVGDRVIVDTTSLLRPAEGFLVGSAAAFLFHVASEAVGSRFSRARPFRVNAGSAHSYVLMADGSTRYLAELSPGDSVLATQPGGERRAVRVGRLKFERRPMVLVTAEDRGVSRTVFLQEAETVRLSGESSRVAMTELTAGVPVWGVRLPAARHLGRAIDETVEER